MRDDEGRADYEAYVAEEAFDALKETMDTLDRDASEDELLEIDKGEMHEQITILLAHGRTDYRELAQKAGKWLNDMAEASNDLKAEIRAERRAMTPYEPESMGD